MPLVGRKRCLYRHVSSWLEASLACPTAVTDKDLIWSCFHIYLKVPVELENVAEVTPEVELGKVNDTEVTREEDQFKVRVYFISLLEEAEMAEAKMPVDQD